MLTNNKLRFIFLVGLFFLNSCQRDQAGNLDNDNKEEKIKFYVNTDSLEIYNPFDYRSSEDAEVYIFKYINVSCPTCLNDISELNKLSIKLDNSKVMLVCHSDDYFEYFKYLVENGSIAELQYPVYLDTSGTFLRRNNVFQEFKNDNIVYTDSNHLVLYSKKPFDKRSVLNAISGSIK